MTCVCTAMFTILWARVQLRLCGSYATYASHALHRQTFEMYSGNNESNNNTRVLSTTTNIVWHGTMKTYSNSTKTNNDKVICCTVWIDFLSLTFLHNVACCCCLLFWFDSSASPLSCSSFKWLFAKKRSGRIQQYFWLTWFLCSALNEFVRKSVLTLKEVGTSWTYSKFFANLGGLKRLI